MKKIYFSLKHLLVYKFKSILKYNKSEILDEKRRIVISLTTLPNRFYNIKKTISSLIYQTKIPDEIVIAVPEYSVREKQEYTIPNFLNDLQKKAKHSGLFIKHPEITILKSEKDWGPATKFIPALQREFKGDNSKFLLIVVDDDQIYQRTMVSNFIKYHQEYPDVILCNRGRNLDKSYLYANSKVILGPRINSVTKVDIITGVGGYLLNPDLLDNSIWNYEEAPKGAFYMDDIWISGYFAKKEIKRFAIPAQSEILYKSKRDSHQARVFKKNKDQSKTITLSDIPCQDSNNPREFYNNEVIDHYKDYWG